MPPLIPVILAGGSGTRLWPLSREEYPKQLLRLTAANTLLQETVMRLDGLSQARHPGSSGSRDDLDIQPPIVSCHEDHRFLTLSQLEAIDRIPQRVVLEPCGRNTAPALTIVALTLDQPPSSPPLPTCGERVGVRGKKSPDPILLVMPADHVIADLAAFHRAVTAGAKLAREPVIVTFGIVPTHPETGYGYIRTGDSLSGTTDDADAYAVDSFVEKPDSSTAESYLASRDYLWNSGIFIVRASIWLAAMNKHRPDILEACRSAVRGGTGDGLFFRVESRVFDDCPSDSIDYAVMEPLTHLTRNTIDPSHDGQPITAAVIPLDAGWSDIGSWRTLLDLGAASDEGNVVQGDVFTHDTRESLLIARSRLLAVIGIKDAVVVETPDAVLVADKAHTQDVRKVVGWLQKAGRGEYKAHRRVHRPWGHFEQLDAGDGYQVKRLTVKPGAALSLQRHHRRAEHWVVVRGEAKVTRGDDVFHLAENESTYIPIGVAHRLENPGTDLLEVIEVQSGEYLGEDDIERLEDRYDRLG